MFSEHHYTPCQKFVGKEQDSAHSFYSELLSLSKVDDTHNPSYIIENFIYLGRDEAQVSKYKELVNKIYLTKSSHLKL